MITRLTKVFVALLFASLVLGCSRADRDGQVRDFVEGQVYYEGKPLPTGYIHFIPFDYSRPPELLPVRDGYFKGRVAGGKKYLHVTATRELPNKRGPSGEPVLEQMLPPYYPLSSLLVELKGDGTDPAIELDLLRSEISQEYVLQDRGIYDRLIEQNRRHREARAQAKAELEGT